MILIGLGSNLPWREFNTPLDTLSAAVLALDQFEVVVTGLSHWYRSRPVPESDQPDYVNGVAAVRTSLPPAALLAALHRVEDRFGRVRVERWGARTLDLDLLAYHDLVQPGGGGEPVLPHPRLTERAFVLRPLVDVAPEWRHPIDGRSAVELLRALPPGPGVEPLDEQSGAG